MKLSAAIRIGSMTTTQITLNATDDKNGRCAIGAAIDACGVKVNNYTWDQQARKLFPILDKYPAILRHIWQMNDMDLETRETIADYVESVEMSLDGEQVMEQIEKEIAR